MDSSKLFLADWRHRALLHNTFGIHVFEQLLGPAFKRESDGAYVCTRTVLSQHIMEDLGAIPSPGEFLREMPLKSWMAGIRKQDKIRMQNLTIEGDGNKEAYITSSIVWRLIKNEKPEEENYYLVSWKGTSSVSYLRYVPSENAWYNTDKKKMDDKSLEYWAKMPIPPTEP